MDTSMLELQAVESDAQRDAARSLIGEYLAWVAGLARERYGIRFDVDAMARSDLEDRSKFFPPAGRLYLVRWQGRYVGVGALRQLDPGTGELQRMYVQPAARGFGAGRLLLQRLLDDARQLGHVRVRLESLKALEAAHGLYRSAGFGDIDPYADNSMQAYQAPEALPAYRASAVFMELRLDADTAASQRAGVSP
jgi:GNAT superfamily N-acetyltransferase